MTIKHAIYSEQRFANRPLVVLLHGYGSNENDLPGLAELAFPDFDYVSLQAPHAIFGGFPAYAWFNDPVPAHNERTDQAKLCAEDIMNFLKYAAKSGEIHENRRLILMGFSQGGAMVSYILQSGMLKSRLAAAVNLSGYLPFRSETTPVEGVNLDVDIFHGWGNADDIVPVVENETARDWFALHFKNVQDFEYSGLAHSISLDEVRDLKAFLSSVK
ncbi:MAG: hypothetical protein LBC50_00720 [Candidatus Ancillula sp.]|nr:hypothetical protein [Candidatus Ancillula sp.]